MAPKRCSEDELCLVRLILTGVDPGRTVPVEVGAVRVAGGREVDSFSSLVNPGSAVPEWLLERGGRSDADYSAAPSPSQVFSDLASFIGEAPVAAFHACGAEGAALREHGIELPPSRLLDIRQLAWLSVPYLRDHSLESLASSLSGEEPSWKALEDARLLLHLLERLLSAWEELPSRARAAVALALATTGNPWHRLLYRGGRGPRGAPFPDLTDLLPGARRREKVAPTGSAPNPTASGTAAKVADDAVSILSAEGGLSSLLPDHETRPQQLAMAEAAAQALRDSAFLVVEAGTGVGKSLAYLVPGALHARITGRPMVVSTYTRNLQEQLFHRDLPLLSRALGGLEFALLKGRRNYLCLRRWSRWCESLARGQTALHSEEMTPAEGYAFLVPWLLHTPAGDLEEISLELRLLLSGLLEELCSEPEECLRPRCRFQERCFVERARNRAAGSQVVVVNHALLLSSRAPSPEKAAGLVLPEFGHLVIDEAHHLEDVATEAFGLSLSMEDCLRMVEIVSSLTGSTPLAPASGPGEGREAPDALREAAERVLHLSRLLFTETLAGTIFSGDEGGFDRDCIRVDWNFLEHPAWEEARRQGISLSLALQELSSAARRAAAAKAEGAASSENGEERMNEARRLEGLAERSQEGALALRVFFLDPGDAGFARYLRWLERFTQGYRRTGVTGFRLRCAPVEVGEELFACLFTGLDAAVITSASLRVPGSREGFDFFLRRTGLYLVEENGRELRLLALDSPFDYASQSRLYAVRDMPEPPSGGILPRRYMEEVCEAVGDVLAATRGKALVLLTSHQQVEMLHSALQPLLESRGICCLRQRRGEPNALLLDRFRRDRDSVLLATEAFWEGVDVPGESLSAVIVVKLPFRHPEDPVVAGRMDHHRRAGMEGWNSYYLPLAVTLFRQGVGRLIRRSTDRGVVVILDPRFLTRPYGSRFREALPPGMRIEVVGRNEVGAAVRAFFSRSLTREVSGVE